MNLREYLLGEEQKAIIDFSTSGIKASSGYALYLFWKHRIENIGSFVGFFLVSDSTLTSTKYQYCHTNDYNFSRTAHTSNIIEWSQKTC